MRKGKRGGGVGFKSDPSAAKMLAFWLLLLVYISVVYMTVTSYGSWLEGFD